MKVLKTKLENVLLIQPSVYSDSRGYFLETYQIKRYDEAGVFSHFVQDNMSFSNKGVLHGLHYQCPHDQAKLVQVISGKIFDVAVDIRLGSPNFGNWFGTMLSDDNKGQLFIPAGFAHGFCVLSSHAIVSYKCSEYYCPESDRGIHWDDQTIGIKWPISNPILSEKDAELPYLKEIPESHLPKQDSTSIKIHNAF